MRTSARDRGSIPTEADAIRNVHGCGAWEGEDLVDVVDVVDVVEGEVWGVRRRRRTAVEASAIRVLLSATQDCCTKGLFFSREE